MIKEHPDRPEIEAKIKRLLAEYEVQRAILVDATGMYCFNDPECGVDFNQVKCVPCRAREWFLTHRPNFARELFDAVRDQTMLGVWELAQEFKDGIGTSFEPEQGER